jgi:ABC-type nitrate/sulfonate/bicarbonate transport system substrate-binding protein
MKGNGMFVRKDGPVREPRDLAGRLIGSHQGPHAIHRYLLRRKFAVDDAALRWVSHPQEKLLAALKRGEMDAVVLLDQFFFRGEQDPEVACLYTDGEIWQSLFGFPEMIKHMIAMQEALWHDAPELKDKLQAAFRASFAYSEQHLEEIAAEFVKNYPGDQEALLASARYPKIEFTFTETEQKIADTEMEMMVEVGWLTRKAPIASLFAC